MSQQSYQRSFKVYGYPRFVIALAVVLGILSLCATVIAVALALISPKIAVWLVATLLVMSGLIAARAYSLREGVVQLLADRFEVRFWAMKYVIRWRDVANVSLTDALTGSGPKLLGVQSVRPLVEVEVTNRIREGLLPWRYGTDIVGTPVLWTKKFALALDDPEEFVAAVKPFLASGPLESSDN